MITPPGPRDRYEARSIAGGVLPVAQRIPAGAGVINLDRQRRQVPDEQKLRDIMLADD